MYIPNYTKEFNIINLWHKDNNFQINNKEQLYLTNQLKRLPKKCNINTILTLSSNLYNKGFSANNIIDCLKDNKDMISVNFSYNTIKYEIYDELFLIQILLTMYCLRSKKDLENIFII